MQRVKAIQEQEALEFAKKIKKRDSLIDLGFFHPSKLNANDINRLHKQQMRDLAQISPPSSKR